MHPYFLNFFIFLASLSAMSSYLHDLYGWINLGHGPTYHWFFLSLIYDKNHLNLIEKKHLDPFLHPYHVLCIALLMKPIPAITYEPSLKLWMIFWWLYFDLPSNKYTPDAKTVMTCPPLLRFLHMVEDVLKNFHNPWLILLLYYININYLSSCSSTSTWVTWDIQALLQEGWSEPRHEIDTYAPKENLLAVV